MAETYSNIFSRIKNTVSDFLGKLTSRGDRVPEEGEKDVAAFVTNLFEESKRWREAYFAESQKIKAKGEVTTDLAKYLENQQKLEAGNHWDVFGRRAEDAKSEWKHEMIDDEIGNQIRARLARLTASWHEIAVMPNIQHLDSIVRDERERTQWGDMILEMAKRMKTFGVAYVKTILDKTEDPNGIVREVVLDNLGVFRTPYSTSFKKADGCWYVIEASMQNLQQVKSLYPNLDANKLDEAVQARMRQIQMMGAEGRPNFQYTKLVDHLSCWMDDDTLEDTPFDEAVFQEKLSSLLEGSPPSVDANNDNHPEFARRYTEWLEETVNTTPETEQDFQKIQTLAELVASQIEEHLETDKARQESGIPSGQRRKYPFGRKVVVVSTVLAEDGQNPYGFEWRRLFHEIYNEKVPARPEGRSDVEILYNNNKVLDTMLSRIADSALAVGMPKAWFNINDKTTMEEEGGFSNDPTKPGYYSVSPPTFPQGHAPQEFLALYQQFKANSGKLLGVTDITFGEAPTSRASGDLAEILQMQNEILITGEANVRIMNAIKDFIETRILMWKRFYTEPRPYFIEGEPQYINVSRLLTERINPQTGQVEEIPAFEVTVKPGSNFPKQWEIDFQVVLMLFDRGILPREAVYDLLKQKYPQFGRNGEFYRLNEATLLGMQMMEQGAEKAKEEEQDIKMVANRFKRMGLNQLTKNDGGNNGGTTNKSKRVRSRSASNKRQRTPQATTPGS